MSQLDLPLRQTKPILVSCRREKYLFCTADTREVAVVDSAGKAVFDCFDTPTTPRKVMRHKAVSHADPAQQLRDMATMVDLLLEKGFLVAADQDAAVEDEAPPPPSPDEIRYAASTST